MQGRAKPNTNLAKPPVQYEDNVFMNCPFDTQYKPIFNAIVFAIHDAGFVARCGLEAIGSEKTRLSKLMQIIYESKYGIHDISRTDTGNTGLPRFNMPFECGLFWGCQQYGDGFHKDKRILVLDSKPFQYQSSMSDIAGQDILVHENKPKTAVNCIRSWLVSASGRTDIPGGNAIWAHYSLFKKDLPALRYAAGITAQELDQLEYYSNYVNLAVEWLKRREAEAI